MLTKYLLLLKPRLIWFFPVLFAGNLAAQPCDLTITIDVGECVAASSTLPVNVTIGDPYDEAKEIDILLDNVAFPWSPIDIDDIFFTTFTCWVTPGEFHTIFTQSTDTVGCEETLTFYVPPCVCALNASATIAGQCNSNQQVPVNVSVDPTNPAGNGFNLFIDGSLSPGSPFTYSASGTSTVVTVLVPGTGTAHTLLVQDQVNPGCNDVVNITTPLCVSPPCSISASSTVTGPCDSTGHVPVTTTITAQNHGSGGFQLLLDGQLVPGSPFVYGAGSSTVVVIPAPGNGASHTIQVIDVGQPDCTAQTSFTTPNCASPPACTLTSSVVVTGPCTANNQVPVAVTVTSSGNSNAGFNVFLDGALTPGSPFTYASGSSTTVNLFVNGNGALHTFQIQDAAIPSCSAFANVTTPNCILPCSLTATVTVTGPCTANNQVPVAVTVFSSGNSNAGFNVFLDGALTPGSPFVYAAGSSTVVDLTVSGNGGIHLIQVQDAQILNCSASAQVTTPNCTLPCALTVSAGVAGPCNSAGMVPVDLMIGASGGGTGGFNLFIDGTLAPGSPYGYSAGSSTTISLNVPGNGAQHLFQVQDAQIFNCISTTYLTTPLCQNNCTMNMTATVSGSCDENGMVPVAIQLTASSGSNGFNLMIDGAISPGSPYNYAAGSSTAIQILLNGDGNVHLLQAQDIGTPGCNDAATLALPLCSGGPCAIGPLRTAIGLPQIIEVQVDDNFYNPSVIHAVTGDTIRFVWVGMHEHTVTSDTLSGPNAFNSGLHGAGYQFDVVTPVTGNFPFYCIPHGSPGGIGMSGVMEVKSPCDDGLLPVSISFTADGGSTAGYFLMLDGNAVPGNPFGYSSSGDNNQLLDVPADGNAHTINITDASNPACTSTAIVQMADCNDPCFGFNAGATIQINHFDLMVDFAVTAPASGTSWTWNFGDGASGEGQSVNHIYSAPGTYTACLIAQSSTGCFDSTCYEVVLLDVRCAAKYAWNNTGLTVSFNNQSAAAGPFTNISWNFGDGGGSQETDPVHIYAVPGIYEVCLTITADTCTDTYCTTLDLSDPCLVLNAGYTYQNLGDPLKFQFTDITSGNPDQWLWGFGDGQTSFSQHPQHVFAAAGVYNVCLITGNSLTGCYAPVFCKQLGVGVNAVIDPAEQPAITLFPNPLNGVRSECFVSGLPAAFWGKQLDVFIQDIQGRLMATTTCSGGEMARLNMPSGLPPGMYFVKIMSETTVFTGKLIIR